MPNLTVNNNTYAYPDPGTEAGWGSDATGWAEDVTAALDSLAGTGTINETQAIIELTATDQDIAGLAFNSSVVQAATVAYRISRVTTGGGAEQLTEAGTLEIVYDPANSQWVMTRTFTNAADVRVSMDISGNTTGQVIYSSLALTGSNYNGIIRFKTVSILKTT